MNAPALDDDRVDPQAWRLDGRVGWRVAVTDRITVTADAVRLQLLPDPSRAVTEDSGALGGAAEPTGVAVAPDGGIYLVDTAGAQVLRFDPCCAGFAPLPCLGGVGCAPRQLREPRAVAVTARGELVVVDTGNRRVQVFAAGTLALLGVWGPLDAAGRPVRPADPFPPGTWEPWDAAEGVDATTWVSDRANGRLHRFDRSGRWLGTVVGGDGARALRAPTALAVDLAGRIYVVDAAAHEVVVLDADGRFLDRVPPAGRVGGRWRPTAVATDPAGNLYIADAGGARLCCYRCDGPPGTPVRFTGGTCLAPVEVAGLAFDRSGAPLLAGGRGGLVALRECRFADEGRARTDALDSGLPGCTWHRVVLEGTVADATLVQVDTYTAEVERTPDELAALDEAAWVPAGTWARPAAGGPWNALVRSAPGRFLWLRLTLRSGSRTTPTITSVRVEFPRLSSSALLPAVFRAEPGAADFLDRYLSISDAITRGVEAVLDGLPAYLDPLSAPAAPSRDFLSWLASWLGLPVDPVWAEPRRRRLVAAAGELYRTRGTPAALRRVLRVLLGLDDARTPDGVPGILEGFQLRRWLFVGEARLGDCSTLWGRRIVDRLQLDVHSTIGSFRLVDAPDPLRDPFIVHAHRCTVFVPAARVRSEGERRALSRAVALFAPAGTDVTVEYVTAGLRVGVQATVGTDAVIGGYPDGVALGERRLGPDAVLQDGPDRAAGPRVRVGSSSLIGSAVL